MTFWQELQTAIRERHPDAICLGGACYLRLDGGNLAKVESASSGGYYDGLRLTVLNRLSGPVDAVSLRSWDMPHRKRSESTCGENAGWDICRPSPDISALWELAEEYLRLFREPDSEMR